MGYKSRENKGKDGEAQIINELLKAYDFTLFHNVKIPAGDKAITELDILLITEKGIFIIESKNIFGTVVGRLDQNSWLIGYGGKKTITFPNPTKQNQYHVEKLKQLLVANLGVKTFSNDELYKSVVIFGKETAVEPSLLGHVVGLGYGDIQILKVSAINLLLDRIQYAKPIMSLEMVESVYRYINMHYSNQGKTCSSFKIDWTKRNDVQYKKSNLYGGKSSPF